MSRKVGTVGEPLGVADGLISRQSAVHRLPQQVGQRLFGYSCLAGAAPLCNSSRDLRGERDPVDRRCGDLLVRFQNHARSDGSGLSSTAVRY
jgi:hypothetical protein